jgi:hypothetical protein
VKLERISRDYRVGVAKAFVENRLQQGFASFTLPDLCQTTGLSELAAQRQIQRMGSRIVKLPRKAFFLIVSPEHQAIGAPPPSWWLDDYFRWLKHPYYVALQSAAAMHGVEPQAVQMTQVMTDYPRKDLEVGRLHLRFFLKRIASQTPTQMLTGARAPLKVSTPASTILDLIRYAPRIGGLSRAWETGSSLLAQVSAKSLREALEAEHEPALGQRVGYLLQERKHPLAEVVAKWLPSSPPWALLAVGTPSSGSCPRIERWRLIQNSDL